MRVLADALRPDSPGLSPDERLLYAYGVYLKGGGRPDDFLDMDMDDVQTLLLAHDADMSRLVYNTLKGLGEMFGGDGNRWRTTTAEAMGSSSSQRI